MDTLPHLKLRCRRGMKELDVIFERYLQRHYPQADAAERRQLGELLDMQDPYLFGIVFGLEPVPGQYASLIRKLAHYD